MSATFLKITKSILHIPPAFVLLLYCSCNEETLPLFETSAEPRVHVQDVQSNRNNVLSAVVQISATNATDVRIEVTGDANYIQHTPFTQVSGRSVSLAILGLEQNTTYTCRVLALSENRGEGESARFVIATDGLPTNIPRRSVVTNNSATDGYVLLVGPSADASGRHYAYIVDNDGRVVWYRAFSSSMLDFQKQPDGSYTAFSSLDTTGGRFFQMDNLGNVLREYRALGAPETGGHELRLRDDGYCLFGVEYRIMDLSAIGGLPGAEVRGLTVEYHRWNGTSLIWNTFDHFSVSDALPDIPITGPNVNPWHGNAIEVDTDGHLLVSFRGMGEITKINSATGEIIWRMGGRNNQFTFVNDPLNGFSHQHGIRRLPNGNIILFDNGNLHSPPASRAVEYRLDEQSKIAQLVWEYRPNPPISSPFLGFAQRLANGHTLVCFGRAQRIIEVDGNGTVVWELRIDEPGIYAYRAIRISSLY